ncbi:amidase family protein [Paenibacillus validus]|nr:amidase family protein [Paenibacillus validus]MED4607730.1 amidase family protein [Paenibacillus validus]
MFLCPNSDIPLFSRCFPSLPSVYFVSPFSGFPAITVPAGYTTDGLGVGIEFLGRAFDEATLIKLAYAYEQGTHHRKPPVLVP